MKSRSEMAADLVASGEASKSEAARRFGLTPWAVGFVCKRRGLPLGTTDLGRQAMGRGRTEERRKANGYPEPSQLLKLYEKSNGSYSDIAAQFNMTRGQVAGFINRARKEAAV
jgi:transposase-like protein